MHNKHKHSPTFPQGPRPLSDRVMITQVNKQLRSTGWTAQGLWINHMLKHSGTVRKLTKEKVNSGQRHLRSAWSGGSTASLHSSKSSLGLQQYPKIVLEYCGPQYTVWFYMLPQVTQCPMEVIMGDETAPISTTSSPLCMGNCGKNPLQQKAGQ